MPPSWTTGRTEQLRRVDLDVFDDANGCDVVRRGRDARDAADVRPATVEEFDRVADLGLNMEVAEDLDGFGLVRELEREEGTDHFGPPFFLI